MRKHVLRIVVALSTLALSLVLVGFLNLLHKAKPLPYPTEVASPSATPSQQFVGDDPIVDFPETTNISPWEIMSFIDNTPYVNLNPLWERLHISNRDEMDHLELSGGYSCTTTSNDYNLDDESGNETVLKISFVGAETYRYLVFKYQPHKDKWTLLGHVDAWSKYRDSEFVVLVSNGKSWLVVSSQTASGSGVAAFRNTVLTVTGDRLQKVLDFPSETYQFEDFDGSFKETRSRILDAKKVGNETRVVIDFEVEYSLSGGASQKGKDLLLFRNHRVGEFVQTSNQIARLDTSRSSLTQHQLDHVHNIDSMTESDFLKYNRPELLRLVTNGTRAQKSWLESYLRNFDNSAEKRQLLRSLAN